MPIVINSPIRLFAQDEFHALAHQVLGVAFELHNEYGRLLEEALFKRLIAARCAVRGLAPVSAEVRIRVAHLDFTKDYFMDLLFGHGLPLEAKTVETLVPGHRAQTLNYLLLAGLRHGLLVNLRPHRVQHEFVSTTLDPAARKQFRVADRGWRELDADSARLKSVFLELLADWGAYLEVALYREAIIHFFGGAARVCRKVDVFDGNAPIGTQTLCLLNNDLAFACTAITRAWDQMRDHQRRFLAHTRLRAVQWVNLNHATIEFATITREGLAES